MLPICMVCLPNYLIIHQHVYVLMSRNPSGMECREACFSPSYSPVSMKIQASSIIFSIYLFISSVSVCLRSYALGYPILEAVPFFFSFRRQCPDLFSNSSGYHSLCKIQRDEPNRSKSVIQEQEGNIEILPTSRGSAPLSEE